MSFHLYGLLLGMATVTGLLLGEKRFTSLNAFKNKQAASHFFWQCALAATVGGVVGARVWHVGTDWHLYQDSLWDSVKVWHGGLSIIGAVIGGVIGVVWFYKKKVPTTLSNTITIWQILDVSVFGLPFAQAIGRVGNYVNQELYGVATSLPWGIVIDGRRVHPLWAYEALLTVSAGVFIWFIAHYTARSNSSPQIGSGNYFVGYIFYYSFIRFWLDFLRVEKSMSWMGQLGVNQVVLLGIMVVIGVWQLTYAYKKTKYFHR